MGRGAADLPRSVMESDQPNHAAWNPEVQVCEISYRSLRYLAASLTVNISTRISPSYNFSLNSDLFQFVLFQADTGEVMRSDQAGLQISPPLDYPFLLDEVCVFESITMSSEMLGWIRIWDHQP